VGFAAETDDLLSHAREKLEQKRVQFLVANDVSRDDIGFGSEHNEVVVLRPDAEPVTLPRKRKEDLAVKLLDLFSAPLVSSPPKAMAEEEP
jgi:phosphopantothenoylcysteine decarboxylase/phosphopantothenate--cysteine ligase